MDGLQLHVGVFVFAAETVGVPGTDGAVMSAKFAVTDMFEATEVSVRGFAVELSLQFIKVYPVVGTAVTALPLPFGDTVCVVVPVSEPCAPAE